MRRISNKRIRREKGEKKRERIAKLLETEETKNEGKENEQK